MREIKKNILPLLLITLTFVFTAILWIKAEPLYPITTADKIRHISAGLLMNALFITFFLSGRFKFLDKLFEGMDVTYKFHKYTALFAAFLAISHWLLKELVGGKDSIGSTFGSMSLIIFGAIIGLTLFYRIIVKFIPWFSYDKWRFVHRFMLLGYIVGIVHMYLSSRYNLLNLSALSIWTNVTTLIGFISAIYIIFFYQKSGLKINAVIEKKLKLTNDIEELTLRADKNIEYKNGQFMFIKFDEGMKDKDPHPFSIVGGEGNIIKLAYKASGDFTKELYRKVSEGAKVRLDGPFGKIDFNKGKQKQVWIAGGIGITPFISYISNEKNVDKNIVLYYLYRGESRAVYKKELEQFMHKHENFSVRFINSDKEGYFRIKESAVDDNISVYICGPDPMRKCIVKDIKSFNKQNVDINFEEFNLM